MKIPKKGIWELMYERKPIPTYKPIKTMIEFFELLEKTCKTEAPQKISIPGVYLLVCSDEEFVSIFSENSKFDDSYKFMPVGSDTFNKINARKDLLLGNKINQ